MKRILILLSVSCILNACTSDTKVQPKEDNKDIAKLFDDYYNENMSLYPLSATANGEKGYNDRMYIDFTDEYVAKLKGFYSKYLAALQKFDRESLSENDKTSYDVFKHEMDINLEGLNYHFTTYIPFQQFWGLPLTMGQLGSGEGNQPFKT